VLAHDGTEADQMWTTLATAMREIHTGHASKLSFEELYRNAYKLVYQNKGEMLYVNVVDFERAWLIDEIQPKIHELLPFMILSTGGDNFARLTANERRAAAEKFLRGIKTAWEDHKLCMNMTTDILMYMVSNFMMVRLTSRSRQS
jgi:cullin 3